MNYGTSTEVLMHVRCRTLYRIVLIGLVISAPGVLLDADHWWANLIGLDDHRWLHYSIASTPAVFVLLCLLWGLVATAFTVGWVDITPVQLEHETPLELPPITINRAETGEPNPQVEPALLSEIYLDEMT
jgi:hypothetical protein